MALPSLVYYYPNPASFVRKDLGILGKAYRVRSQTMPHFKIGWLPWLLVRQFFHLLWYLPKARLCVVQFASYHSLLPALFCKGLGKPLLIVTGGTDARRVPEIGYGNFNKPFLGAVTGFVLRQATALAPVHQSLSRDTYQFLQGTPTQQGVYNLVPGLTTPSFTVYNGFSDEDFAPTVLPAERPPGTFITLAGDLSTLVKQQTKGIDLLLEAAKALPQFQFTVIGHAGLPNAPSNVRWVRWVDPKDIPAILSQHRFYVQLSATEGFPNALAEAMLCACIPIGSAVAAIPMIIGEAGYVLPKKDLMSLINLLELAEVTFLPANGMEARERIQTYFPIKERERRLLELCAGVANRRIPTPQEWEAGLLLPDSTIQLA